MEPCTLPWKLAEPARSRGCGALPGLGVLNMPAMVATSRRSRASRRTARLDRLLDILDQIKALADAR